MSIELRVPTVGKSAFAVSVFFFYTNPIVVEDDKIRQSTNDDEFFALD